MALKNRGMWKNVLGDEDLVLTAGPEQSFLIRDIFIEDPAGDFLTLAIDKATVGYFRVGSQLGSHLPFSLGSGKHAHDWTTGSTVVGDVTEFAGLENAGGAEVAIEMIGTLAVDTTYPKVGSEEFAPTARMRTLLALLTELGVFTGYPVGSGQSFSLDGAAQVGAIQAVLYDEYDAADILRTQENGSEPTEYMFINYGDAGAAINLSGDHTLGETVNPGYFPAFPFGATVPANTVIDLIGILGSTFAPNENDGTNHTILSYLKLVRERTVLFDDDRNGILFHDPTTTVGGDVDRIGEGFSPVGNYSDIDYKLPLLFDPPLTFEAGVELLVQLNATRVLTGQDISEEEHQIGLTLKVRRG